MKPGAKPTARPRTGGGMGQGLGQFGEHLDESALKQAVGQKSMAQAAADPKMAAAAAQGAKQQQAASTGQATPPREVGTLKEELIKRPLKDIWQEIKQFFTLNTWLGINPDTKDPKEKQKQAAIHQRYMKLDCERYQSIRSAHHNTQEHL